LSVTALLVVSLFGVGGVITELLSHAATPYTSAEAESGALTNNAAEATNATDSNGKAIAFGSLASGDGETTPTWSEEFSARSQSPSNPNGQWDAGTGAKDDAGDG
jgi:hypothetical protein